MDEWTSTSRTIQSSQGHSSLQEDAWSTYEINLLEDQYSPITGMCINPLPAPSKTGRRELLPWTPSRNKDGDADTAAIFGDDSTKQIKLVFNLTFTVIKLKHQTWRVLENNYKINFWLFPSPAHQRMKTGRLIIHFQPSPLSFLPIQSDRKSSGSLAVTCCLFSPSCCDRIPDMLMAEAPATKMAHFWC